MSADKGNPVLNDLPKEIMPSTESSPLIDRSALKQPSGIRAMPEVVVVLYHISMSTGTLAVQQFVFDSIKWQNFRNFPNITTQGFHPNLTVEETQHMQAESVAVLGIFNLLVIPVTYSVASKLVTSEEQGVNFAGVACVEGLMSLIGVAAFNSMYSSTLQISPGFVFIVMAGVEILGLALACSQVFFMRKERASKLHKAAK